MRPLHLRLKGFTAFRDEQVVHFEALDLFAITGPTGSGKSSLLDAMTFALYGRCERVGDRVRQLVSQGQPTAAVTLTFAVGDERYRVTRRISNTGAATKILLERHVDGDWRQFGEGADRVREAEASIRNLLGLDYTGFTRAVLLPQGRFAEFLTGDATERRRILVDLLDLGLFNRMGAQARVIAGEAKIRAEADAATLAREYAEATPEALGEARKKLTEAETRVRTLDEAREAVIALAERWRAVNDEAASLRALSNEARGAARAALKDVARIDELARSLAAAEKGVVSSEADEKARAAELTAAAERLADALERWGEIRDVTEARATAMTLARDVATKADLEGRRAAQEGALTPLAKAVAAAEGRVGELRAAEEAARSAVMEAEQARAAAERADLVAAVSQGLAVGSPCPVCDRVLEHAPAHTHAPDLKAAVKALEKARATAATAERARRGAEDDLSAARESLERQRGIGAQIDRELEACAVRIKDGRAALTARFPEGLPDDPVAVLTERADELSRLTKAREEARDAADKATKAAEERRRAVERLRGEIREIRAEARSIVTAARSIGERAATASGDPELGASLPAQVDLPEGAPELSATLTGLAPALDKIAGALDAAASLAEARAQGIVDEARERVARVSLEESGSLEDMNRGLDRAVRGAERSAASAEQRIADLEARIAGRKELEEQVRRSRARASLFGMLANELRGDRIIAFLEGEALEVLAVAGGEHLAALSDGRYRLAVVSDDFMVIDTWNGDEQRSVRTLSGGETFLASLALARALSEQVPTLAVNGRERVASLFLDEGFGTLDPDSLELVIGAIDSLGGDGRLVGVVTHVRELAERLPARIEVEKSPRGSRISLGANR